MTTSKLLDALSDFFDSKKKEQRKRKSNLKTVLAKLKKQCKLLQKKLDNETNNKKRKQLKRELDTICAKRKKGIKLLRSL